jgi:hypothetical protein
MIPRIVLAFSWLPIAYTTSFYLLNFESGRISILITLILLGGMVIDKILPRTLIFALLPFILGTSIYYVLTFNVAGFTDLAVGNLLALPALMIYAMFDEREAGMTVTLYFLAYVSSLFLASTVSLGATDPQSLLRTLATLLLVIDLRSLGSFVAKDVPVRDLQLLNHDIFSILTLIGGVALMGYLLLQPTKSSGTPTFRFGVFRPLASALLIASMLMLSFASYVVVFGGSIALGAGVIVLGSTIYLLKVVRKNHAEA